MSAFFTRLQRFISGKSLRAQLTASRLNTLIDTVERNQLQPGKGYRVTKTASGTVLEIPKGNQTSKEKEPFQILRNSANTIRILPGQLNSITPTIDGDPITDDPAPTIEITETQEVVLKLTIDEDGVATNVEIVTTDTDDYTPTEEIGYLPLGLVTIEDNVIASITQYRTKSHYFVSLGPPSTHLYWT
tara:strand:+ start:35999 stop:36562 length:564 start_codon:yes stop_codon:yes gene_type:complete